MSIEMKVGFAKVDTTPDYPTLLGGYRCDPCRFPAGETEKLTNRLVEIVTELRK